MPLDLDYALLSPVKLPEFGSIEVGWAMCLNPMWEHFGAFFGPEDMPGSAAPRYKEIDGKSVRLRCGGCGQSGSLHAHASLRAVARHFLSESFPFADCANEQCPNHGRNAFEHFGQADSTGFGKLLKKILGTVDDQDFSHSESHLCQML